MHTRVSTRSRLEPLYFGTATKQLFGCYLAPQAGPPRDCGVVLCPPLGREYIRSHRTYRQLAYRLCDVGFHVLRFDLYGCGDSSGDTEQGGISQWLDDISIATTEMRRRCDLPRVCLAGLRFGGTLALLAGVEKRDIESLVLWNPVVNGRAHIEELLSRHRELLPDLLAPEDHPHPKPTELLGFPFTDSLLADLDNLDLLSVRQKPANNIMVIESTEEACNGRLGEHLRTVAPRIDYQCVPGPEIWRDQHNKPLISGQVIRAMVTWISAVGS